MGGGGEAHRRPDRRGHFHRFWNPGFSRTPGRVDQGSAGGEALRHPLLRGRSRDTPEILAVAPRLSGLDREPQRRPRRDRGARAARQAPRAHHPEHRWLAPESGQLGRARDRGPRHCARRGVPLLRVEGTHAGYARASSPRRARSAVHALRRDPEERYHFVRAGVGAGSDRSCDERSRRGRLAYLDRHQPAGLSDRRGGSRGEAGRRPGSDRQRTTDPVRRNRRRRAPR
jgi:hypothetical protein